MGGDTVSGRVHESNLFRMFFETNFSSNQRKSISTLWTKAENGKIFVQRGDPVNTKSLHYGKAGPVNDGKILIGPRGPDVPGCFQVRQANRLNEGDPTSQTIPKKFSCFAMKLVVKQGPRFNQNVIGCDQGLAGFEKGFGAGIASIRRVGRGIPDRCVDK
jgi:hypothetical protein